MIKITVFKDTLRYESDLVKNAKNLGLSNRKKQNQVWKEAKEITSSIDWIQHINPGDGFYNLKEKEQQQVLYSLGNDIASGRGFKVELT